MPTFLKQKKQWSGSLFGTPCIPNFNKCGLRTIAISVPKSCPLPRILSTCAHVKEVQREKLYKRIYFKLGLEKTTVDIYVWQVDSFKKLPSLEIQQAMDIAVFKDDAKACLVVLEEDTRVYCSEDYSQWTTNEILLTKGGQKVSFLGNCRKLNHWNAFHLFHVSFSNFIEFNLERIPV